MEADEGWQALVCYRHFGTSGVLPLPPPTPHPEARRIKVSKVGAASLGGVLEEHIQRVVNWLRKCPLTDVTLSSRHAAGKAAAMTADGNVAASDAIGVVLGSSTRQTFQQTKTYKHRAQVEAIASHCVRCLPSTSTTIVELGAGQAVLGHVVSMTSGLPLVAIDRRGNTDAFDMSISVTASGGDCSVDVSRVQADIADPDAWPQTGELTLLAKHLCGHGSDLAVDAAVTLETTSRLSLLCLAPCCHAKMQWDHWSEESRRWFHEAGFPGEKNDFALLLDVIRLSRVGEVQAGKPVPCSKWRMRQYIDPDEIELLGRRACRAIDEARLARLRASGLQVALVEYCDASLSPDNVLILAAPQLAFSSRALTEPVNTIAQEPELRVGAVLELDPTAPPTVLHRFVSFLHEQQARGRFSTVCTFAPLADSSSSRVPAVICTGRQGARSTSAGTLVADLLQCPFVSRIAVRIVPFDHEAQNCHDLAKSISSQLAEAGPDKTVRVSTRPRALEKALIPLIGPKLLAPARFTHTVFVIADGSQDSGGVLRFTLLPRSVLDPTAFAASKESDDSSGRAYWRFFEVAYRWTQRFEGVKAVALWTDDRSDCLSWMERWVTLALPAQADIVTLRLQGDSLHGGNGAARTESGTTWRNDSLTATWTTAAALSNAPSNVLLCDVSFGCDQEAIETLRSLLALGTTGSGAPLAMQGTVVLRLRPGRASRAVKRWHRDMTRQLEERLEARQIELLHLLSDKEPERTAIFSWRFTC